MSMMEDECCRIKYCIMRFALLFFLMIRRPPRATRTDTLFPYTTLFRSAGRVQDALQSAGAASTALTDEASAMELADYSPRLVPGSARNFKVTWPEDFSLMEKWL